MCKPTISGIYALKTEVDVWFKDVVNSPELFDPGRGKITIYLKGELSGICDDGTGGKGVVRSCGTRLPPIYSDAAHGVVQIQFPDELWEKPGVPAFNTTGHATGFNPGDMLVLDKGIGLVGIDLAMPDATWPTPAQTATFMCTGGKTKADCFPDMDGDMNPGVTVTFLQTGTPPDPGYTTTGGWKYVPAPTQISDALGGGMVGASEAYIGLRTKLGGAGALSADCKSGAGNADVDDFESRVWDCKMKAGAKCTVDGAQFLDKITPTFHVLKAGGVPPAEWKYPGLRAAEVDPKLNRMPSVGPKTSVVRLGDIGSTVSCADVRGAAYPPNQ
jgi:hypothetical protein